jgi:hypothetical protein
MFSGFTPMSWLDTHLASVILIDLLCTSSDVHHPLLEHLIGRIPHEPVLKEGSNALHACAANAS